MLIRHNSYPRSMRRLVTILAFAIGTAACSVPSSSEPPPQLPHVVVLIADDLGTDWGPCQDAPSTDMQFLQSVCEEARVYTRTYAQPVCTPSRASMMTGQFTARHGASDVQAQATKLPLSARTLPEVARASGAPHRFSAYGKWHLSSDGEGGDRGPLEQGFDYHAGNPRQHDTYRYFDYDWFENGELMPREPVYKTTRIVDAVTAQFDRHHADGPQFHWVGFVSPHIPYHVPPDGLHEVEGLPPAGTVWSVSFDYPPPPGSFRIFRANPDMVPPFRAMLQALDHEIERLVRHIEATADRPVVFIFLGDNGTSAEVYRGPAPAVEGGGRAYRAKGSVYEGGTRVPLMIWSTDPALVPPGRDARLTQLVDLFPTLASLSGGQPGPSDGLPLQPFGASPDRAFAYTQRGDDRRTAYVFAATDPGRVKLILNQTTRPHVIGLPVPVEVYEVANDPAEARNFYPDDLCNVGRARVDALFAEIARINAVRPDEAFEGALFRDRLDDALASCP